MPTIKRGIFKFGDPTLVVLELLSDWTRATPLESPAEVARPLDFPFDAFAHGADQFCSFFLFVLPPS